MSLQVQLNYEVLNYLKIKAVLESRIAELSRITTSGTEERRFAAFL